MELQGRIEEFGKTGMGLAAISYDSRETLKAFADRKGITFTLLSDPGSAIIERYGLLNRQAAPEREGIPHPGTFVLDANGVVTARFFEPAYQTRSTMASMAMKLGHSVGGSEELSHTISTDHLEIVAQPSDEQIAPGSRFSLVLDVSPHERMHVYAPGDHSYRVIGLTIEPQPGLVVYPVEYPPSQEYYFEPLDERVPVYEQPFRLVQDLEMPVTADSRTRASQPGATLDVQGAIQYQACDDKVCYPAVSVPVSWTLNLKPLER